jgi:peptidyl-prolyl cis-trans isomerase C
MTGKLGVFLLILSGFVFAGCTGGLPEHVIARVNQEDITLQDLDRELKELTLDPGKGGEGTASRELRQACLDQLIERKLLAQEARKRGLRIPPDELNAILGEILKEYPGGGFDERLGLKGTTLEEWKGRLEEGLLAERMARSVLQARVEVSEKEAEQYYEARRSAFQMKPRVRVRQIIVADGQEAIQILKRIRKGESFEKLARERSLGPEKASGGDLGAFGPGERPAEFDPVFTLDAGAVSEVIKSPYGYHIFKLEGKSPGRQLSYAEARETILRELRQRKGEEVYRRWLGELRKQAEIRINSGWLRS